MFESIREGEHRPVDSRWEKERASRAGEKERGGSPRRSCGCQLNVTPDVRVWVTIVCRVRVGVFKFLLVRPRVSALSFSGLIKYILEAREEGRRKKEREERREERGEEGEELTRGGGCGIFSTGRASVGPHDQRVRSVPNP